MVGNGPTAVGAVVIAVGVNGDVAVHAPYCRGPDAILSRMKVLVACEFSGVVRDAFAVRGHDAWSADLLPSERPGQHYQGDVRDILGDGWDLLVAHPPCTYLARSGARWHAHTERQAEAVAFVRALYDAPIERVAIENPIGMLKSLWRRSDQIVQPWWFGHGEVKATALWLKNLPPLLATDVVEGRVPRVHYAAPGPDRWKVRSRTLSGLAEAMAQQWG